MIYDEIMEFVYKSDIDDDKKYIVYHAMKKALIDITRECYKELCEHYNGSADRTGQSVITFESACESLHCTREFLENIVLVMIHEKITELQGGMIVL